jgi:DNA helicase-2/ATP-dependent DNA helicase PcrA
MPASLDGLDRNQRAAVTHRGGPLLILGGPGTGKTHVLAQRTAWLVDEGTPAAGVLVLAPTAAGAGDLRQRIEVAIDTAYDELSVYGAQELCERLLRDEALEAGLDPLFAPVSAADRLALLLERIDDLPLRRHEIRGNPAPLLAGFVERIDRLKEEMVRAQDFRRWAEAQSAVAESDDERTRAERELEFANVYAAHDRLLAHAGALDVGDLTLHAFRLLHEKPHVRARLAARFPFVLADGYQDLSFAQGAMTRLLTQSNSELTVAGNDDEAVRRTRGRAAKNLRDFTREHPEATTIVLSKSRRVARVLLQAADAVLAPSVDRVDKKLSGSAGGSIHFWRCQTERAQAQAVAAEVERLVERHGVAAGDVGVFVPSLKDDGPAVAAALEERAIPFRLVGGAAYFQRAEVRDLLAWLRALADPSDAGAVVRALSRPPVDLRSVDIALITQLSRRRKLDMVAAAALAIEGPHLSPEGRDRVQSFLRLYRAAAQAFERMRADAFVHRLIERIGLRRQQLFAAQADTLERLMSIAKLGDLATAYMRREPQATPRDFARYIAAVAESGLPEPEPEPTLPDAVRITQTDSAEEIECDHAFVLGLTAAAMPGRAPDDRVPDELLPETVVLTGREAHEERMRRILYVAMTRARRGVVLAWPEADGARPSPFLDEILAATATEGQGSSPDRLETHAEELFGPAEGLHSTFRIMRDELLDTVARMGGRLKEMRLDTYVDISQAMVRYLELIKVAALIERHRDGEGLPTALREINELLLQVATPEQREAFEQSALDEYLLDAARDERRRAEAVLGGRAEPALDRFIPRRGDGVMLSASDVETYRLCPLKYKFARVFRIPEEPTINQRFGIAVHQVLERFHKEGGGSLEDLMHLFEVAWRRNGFGHSADELQFREKAVAGLTRYWELDREREGEPVWFERGFAFKLGEHFVRGRVDRVDRLPDGSYELIDYKTGWAKTEQQLREDIQLSLYQMGAREAWGLPGSAQSYYYVLENEKVPVEHTDDELDRVRSTVTQIADGILSQEFEPRPRPDICAACDYRIICPAAEK